jgi:hypothetical protein
MKRNLILVLTGFGLVLISASPVFAQAEGLSLRSMAVPRGFNDRTATADFSSVSGGASYPVTANSNARNAATPTLDLRMAILAGVLTLMLLQRRNHANIILKPRH